VYLLSVFPVVVFAHRTIRRCMLRIRAESDATESVIALGSTSASFACASSTGRVSLQIVAISPTVGHSIWKHQVLFPFWSGNCRSPLPFRKKTSTTCVCVPEIVSSI